VGAVPPILAQTPTEKGSKESKADTNTTGFGSITASTEQLSRMLRACRQKLDSDRDGLTNEKLQELERELDATIRVVRQKLAVNHKEVNTTLDVGGAAEDSGSSRTASSSLDVSFVSAQTEVDEETMGGAESSAS
jgi:hypothetical protein